MPLQTTRYLRIVNNTSETITVYLRMPDGPRTQSRRLAAGEAIDLTANDERVALAEVYVWAKSETKAWNSHKDEVLTLVRSPYRSNNIGTFTYNFR